MVDYDDDGAAMLSGWRHPLTEAEQLRRCPDCGLPCAWVHDPQGDHRFPKRPDCRAAERHAQIQRMKRAAAACLAAGYDAEAARIATDIDATVRIRSPRKAAA